MTDKIISPRFASLNNFPVATSTPPRANKIVVIRKYAPIARNGNDGPPPPVGLATVAFDGGGRGACGLSIGPKKSASGACPIATTTATIKTTRTNGFAAFNICTNYIS